MQVSIVNYKTVLRNSDFRYEAEFFLPKYIEQENKLSEIECMPLSDCSSLVNGRAYDSNDFSFTGDIFISKIGDVTQKRDFILWEKVTKKHFEKMNGRYLRHNDILMTLTGDPPDVGKVQLIHNPPNNHLSWNQRVALLRLKKQEKIFYPEYLFAILSSKYCREHIERWAKGIRQRNVGNPAVLKMLIPTLSKKLQNAVKDTIITSFSTLEKSNVFYQQSEQILLEELGLSNWKVEHKLSFVKNFSEAEEAKRIDAEYFQPKYNEIINTIKKTGDAIMLDDIMQHCERGLQPIYEEYGEVVVVNTKHLGRQFMSDNYEACSMKTWEKQEKAQLKQYDILLYGTGANIGRTNCFFENTRAIGSNHVTIIRPDNRCNPVYLSLFLNSKLGLMQTDRHAHGSAQREIYPKDIKCFTCWLPDKKLQNKIANYVLKSYKAQQKSKRLLEVAKQTVEMAIEKDEKTAMEWIEEQGNFEE